MINDILTLANPIIVITLLIIGYVLCFKLGSRITKRTGHYSILAIWFATVISRVEIHLVGWNSFTYLFDGVRDVFNYISHLI